MCSRYSKQLHHLASPPVLLGCLGSNLELRRRTGTGWQDEVEVSHPLNFGQQIRTSALEQLVHVPALVPSHPNPLEAVQAELPPKRFEFLVSEVLAKDLIRELVHPMNDESRAFRVERGNPIRFVFLFDFYEHPV